MAKIAFDVPCFALAHQECSDPLEMARSFAAADFGSLGRCLLLFRTFEAAEHGARILGKGLVVEIGNLEFLTLILDAEQGQGATNVAVDLVRTADGQTACHFHALDAMLADCRHRLGID